MKTMWLGAGGTLAALLILGCIGTTARAADQYVLPQGAGTKDGSSWENARDGAKNGLQTGWDALSPGETCFVGGGAYADGTLKLSTGGTEGKPKKLVGVARGAAMRPVFTSTWTKTEPAKGRDFIVTTTGASYWTLENLEVRSYRNVLVSGGGQHVGVKIRNLDAVGVRAGFELFGGAPKADPTKGSHDWLIEDCDFTHFTKRGIRFQAGNYNVRVANCSADAGGKEWATEPFQMGFSVQGSQTSDKKATEFAPDHDISFENCVAQRSYNDAGPDKYWNADGFVAESTPYNLRYVNCRALDNTDGGWDDKSRNPVLINCVALRNKRNFRFWTTTGVATLTNCVGAFAVKQGGNSTAAGLWTKGNLRAENCTFHDNTIGVDLDEPTAKVELIHCIVSTSKAKSGTLSTVEPGGKLTLTETALWEEGKTGDDPRFASSTWDGTGSGMDSQRWGKTRGYHSGATGRIVRAGKPGK